MPQDREYFLLLTVSVPAWVTYSSYQRFYLTVDHEMQ
jgi:hypothetical protein